jgi:hypothetical protein
MKNILLTSVELYEMKTPLRDNKMEISTLTNIKAPFVTSGMTTPHGNSKYGNNIFKIFFYSLPIKLTSSVLLPNLYLLTELKYYSVTR